MSAATKEKLFKCKSRRYTTVKVGGLEFTFQSLSEAEKSNFEKQVLNKDGNVKDNSRRLLLIATLVDGETHKPLLDDYDLGELGELDGAVTSQLFDAAMSHVGFADNEIEVLEKNSRPTKKGGSPSA